ncbi:LAGLIDADG family homing endonuclease [Alteribacter natronophilus]|uniref:LAGLIDADG family homing endonuclease n=1 Tax=Alteribacter natronophilus TaxID=2583810 RepID=UPI00110EBC26|nr:LAGLIDADG family homing endonuclease [Alteribacter natronophilus]TMW73385.1 hypothetical protein FGB90_03520 [Alteribacter natronophilus]
MKTPQGAFPEEAEAMPAESIRLQRNKTTIYPKTAKTKDIALMAGISIRQVNNLMNEFGVVRRKFGSWKRQYHVNELFFDTWNKDMSYVIGFFTSDGCLNRSMQTISFSQKEKDILIDIRKLLGSNHPIAVNRRTGVHSLNIHSKHIKSTLSDYGFTSAKSTSLDFPEVPEVFLSHYIRGYFDGDGLINAGRNFITFVNGSGSFMTRLHEILNIQGFNVRIEKYNSKHWRVFISGKNSISDFGEWIYKDAAIYIRRKREIFLS